MTDAPRDRDKIARPFLRTPPAWLITVLLFAFSIVTIVLAIAGQ